MVKRATVVFGLHAVKQALKNTPLEQGVLYVLSSRRDTKLQDVIAQAEAQKISIVACARDRLDQHAGSKHHQGVVLHASTTEAPAFSEQDLWEKLSNQSKPALILILDGVQDPHNLGACLRSADAAGVDAVILPKNRSASVTSVVRKVACGAAETLPVLTASNLSRTLQALQKQGVWIVGMDANTSASKPLYQLDLTIPVALVMGNEGEGMRALTMKQCDFMGYLPMQGQVESLNVSVATGVALFEVVRQRSGL